MLKINLHEISHPNEFRSPFGMWKLPCKTIPMEILSQR